MTVSLEDRLASYVLECKDFTILLAALRVEAVAGAQVQPYYRGMNAAWRVEGEVISQSVMIYLGV